MQNPNNLLKTTTQILQARYEDFIKYPQNTINYKKIDITTASFILAYFTQIGSDISNFKRDDVNKDFITLASPVFKDSILNVLKADNNNLETTSTGAKFFNFVSIINTALRKINQNNTANSLNALENTLLSFEKQSDAILRLGYRFNESASQITNNTLFMYLYQILSSDTSYYIKGINDFVNKAYPLITKQQREDIINKIINENINLYGKDPMLYDSLQLMLQQKNIGIIQQELLKGFNQQNNTSINSVTACFSPKIESQQQSL